MAIFYFTWGSDEQYDLHAGWTEVEAENMKQATDIFKTVHPNREGSEFINCAGIYNETDFKSGSNSMYSNGNFGKYCVERLTVLREDCDTIQRVHNTPFQGSIIKRTDEAEGIRDSVKHDCLDNVLDAIIEHAIDVGMYDLTYDEWEELYDRIVESRQFISCVDVVNTIFNTSDFYGEYIEPVVEEIKAERVKYYRIPVHFSGVLDVYVRARDEDTALEYVNGLGDYELSDMVDDGNINYDVDPYSETEEVSEDTAQWEDVFDAE